jgi:hypothetical protein
MAIMEDQDDDGLEVFIARDWRLLLEGSSKGDEGRQLTVRTKLSVWVRSLALTSPSPAPGERRAWTPVALRFSLAPAAGVSGQRAWADLAAKTMDVMKLAMATWMPLPYDLFLGISCDLDAPRSSKMDNEVAYADVGLAVGMKESEVTRARPRLSKRGTASHTGTSSVAHSALTSEESP